MDPAHPGRLVCEGWGLAVLQGQRWGAEPSEDDLEKQPGSAQRHPLPWAGGSFPEPHSLSPISAQTSDMWSQGSGSPQSERWQGHRHLYPGHPYPRPGHHSPIRFSCTLQIPHKELQATEQWLLAAASTPRLTDLSLTLTPGVPGGPCGGQRRNRAQSGLLLPLRVQAFPIRKSAPPVLTTFNKHGGKRHLSTGTCTPAYSQKWSLLGTTLQMTSVESPQHKETCTLLTRNNAAIQLAGSTSLEGLHH